MTVRHERAGDGYRGRRWRTYAGGMSVREVSAGEWTFRVAVDGPEDGEPVILLHGFPEDMTCWNATAALLHEAGMRTYAPDQRGYSPLARPVGTEFYRLPLLAQDIVNLMDALDLPTARLVGHDWGAVVAWYAAAHHTDRFTGAVTISVPHPVPFVHAIQTDENQRQRSAYMQFFQRPDAEGILLADDAAALRSSLLGSGASQETVDEVVGRMREEGALTAALSWYRAGLDSGSDFPPITIPVTFIWSDQDAAIGPTAVAASADHVTGPYRYVELPGVSHWIPAEAASAIAEAIISQSQPT